MKKKRKTLKKFDHRGLTRIQFEHRRKLSREIVELMSIAEIYWK